MPSDALYAALAEALSKPSRAYRTAQAGLAIPQQALEGYLSGTDIGDKLRQRKESRQPLAEILGGNVPERVRPYSQLTLPQVTSLGGLKGLADITEAPKSTMPSSLEEILADRVNKGQLTLEQSAIIKRSMSPGFYQKPPPGFRFDDSGNLVAIPGGEPARTFQEKDEKKKANLQGELDKSRLIIKKIDQALAGAGDSTTGPIGALTKNIPGTPASNLDKTLDTVRANVGFDTLTAMRASSPTGGALGAISDRENTLLQSVRGSLDQKQSLEQLQGNLQDLRTHFRNVTLAIENQTGDPEADDAIAKVIGSDAPEAEKVIRIKGIRAAAGR